MNQNYQGEVMSENLITQSVERAMSPANVQGSVESARAVAQVQAAVISAKRFPRDENEAYAKIMKACSRRSLAEMAVYEYPKGGQKITGPSIRLAETMARCWGNLDYGVVEVSRNEKESVAVAYCLDLESNVRKCVEFIIPHERVTKNSRTTLTDPRDMYENMANMSQRRLRAVVLASLPPDIQEEAVYKCDETLKKGDKDVPLSDRIRNMLTAMMEYGVSKEMIEAKIAHKLEATSESELVKLKRIYISIKDGVGKVTDFFDSPDSSGVKEVSQLLGANTQTQPSQPKPSDPKVTTHSQVSAEKRAGEKKSPDDFDSSPSSLFASKGNPHTIK